MNFWNNGTDYFRKKYGHEIGGIWVPRVTAITEIIAKPALLKYYADQENFEVAQQSLRNAANWGTLTHITIEKLFKMEQVGIDPKIAPSIEAFFEWKSQHDVKIQDPQNDIERMVFDAENIYAGKMDVLAEIDGKIGILDIKTGTGIWDEYFLQTAAYMNAFNSMADKKEEAKTRWILRIDQYEECLNCGGKQRIKSGKDVVKGGQSYCNHEFAPPTGIYEFRELEDFEGDIKAFLNAKKLWEWYNRNLLKKIRNYPKKDE